MKPEGRHINDKLPKIQIYTNNVHYGRGNENNYAVFMQIHEKNEKKPVIVQVIENKIEKFAFFC